MKKLFLISFLFLFGSTLFSNGVGIVNKSQPLYLQLVNTHVSVYVENQVSIVTTTQEFFNNLEMDTTVQYAFPLPDGASATNLRWKINGVWHEALIAPTGNDTTGVVVPVRSRTLHLYSISALHLYIFLYPNNYWLIQL